MFLILPDTWLYDRDAESAGVRVGNIRVNVVQQREWRTLPCVLDTKEGMYRGAEGGNVYL